MPSGGASCAPAAPQRSCGPGSGRGRCGHRVTLHMSGPRHSGASPVVGGRDTYKISTVISN